ncbi:MAG: hypothetical protein GX650_08105 [Clostridiales bacterium]|jgi:neutral ceramidase|nr:hypothetical protein [Clostridiales bacterium]
MQSLKVGFDRTIITPPHGTPISGYFFERLATGVLDDLELNTFAATDGKTTLVLLCADLLQIQQPRMDYYRKAVAEKAGIPYEAVFICCTHTHTGPDIGKGEEYFTNWERTLVDYMVSSAQRALDDLADASIETARGRVERISFIRRYRMKDGHVRTNPGVGNPDILESIGQPDETLQLIRMKRQGKRDVALVNFQVHPDVIGGTLFSADYPRFVRQTVEQALDQQVYCIYLNGAQGDTNHLNTAPLPGESNGLTEQHFDAVRGYEHSKNMGRAIGGEAVKIYGRAASQNPLPLRFLQKTVRVPSNQANPKDLSEAHRIADLHNSGHDDQLPWSDMELTTAVAEALRMVALEHGPEYYDLDIAAITLGDVAILGIPGEPFTQIGLQIKEQSPFAMTVTCCLSNGSEGYFPMKEAYDEGGYEARSSFYKGGVAEIIIEQSVQLLKELHRS